MVKDADAKGEEVKNKEVKPYQLLNEGKIPLNRMVAEAEPFTPTEIQSLPGKEMTAPEQAIGEWMIRQAQNTSAAQRRIVLAQSKGASSPMTEAEKRRLKEIVPNNVRAELGEKAEIVYAAAHGSSLWKDVDVVIVAELPDDTRGLINGRWETDLGPVDYKVINRTYYQERKDIGKIEQKDKDRLMNALAFLYIGSEELFAQRENVVSDLLGLVDVKTRSKDFYEGMLQQANRRVEASYRDSLQNIEANEQLYVGLLDGREKQSFLRDGIKASVAAAMLVRRVIDDIGTKQIKFDSEEDIRKRRLRAEEGNITKEEIREFNQKIQQAVNEVTPFLPVEVPVGGAETGKGKLTTRNLAGSLGVLVYDLNNKVAVLGHLTLLFRWLLRPR